jgi:hypothetical protein
MSSPEVLASAQEIPEGAHCVSFHASRREAAEHAASFLAGASPGHAARYWVESDQLAEFYAGVAGQRAPEHVGCVAVLPKEQVEPVEGKLRPVAEVREFLTEHPDGVTAGAETISAHLTEGNTAEHMEYEAWFQAQSRGRSRFLCPYDLRAVPPEVATGILRELGAHHTHVILSDATDEIAQLLELFVFDSADHVPEELSITLAWALRQGLVEIKGPHRELRLTPAGDRTVRGWGGKAT